MFYGTGSGHTERIRERPVQLSFRDGVLDQYRGQLEEIGAEIAAAARHDQPYSCSISADTYPYTVADDEPFTNAWTSLYHCLRNDLEAVAGPVLHDLDPAPARILEDVSISRQDRDITIQYTPTRR